MLLLLIIPSMFKSGIFKTGFIKKIIFVHPFFFFFFFTLLRIWKWLISTFKGTSQSFYYVPDSNWSIEKFLQKEIIPENRNYKRYYSCLRNRIHSTLRKLVGRIGRKIPMENFQMDIFRIAWIDNNHLHSCIWKTFLPKHWVGVLGLWETS